MHNTRNHSVPSDDDNTSLKEVVKQKDIDKKIGVVKTPLLNKESIPYFP